MCAILIMAQKHLTFQNQHNPQSACQLLNIRNRSLLVMWLQELLSQLLSIGQNGKHVE